MVRPTSQYLIPIADPLADAKLTKRVLKLAKKASQRKQIKRGVKEVVKALRKKFKGCAARCKQKSSCWHAFASIDHEHPCYSALPALHALHKVGVSHPDARAGSAFLQGTYLPSTSSRTSPSCVKTATSHTSMYLPKRHALCLQQML